MKLKFKHQKFQAEATQAVYDVFSGQPFLTETNYLIDQGNVKGQKGSALVLLENLPRRKEEG